MSKDEKKAVQTPPEVKPNPKFKGTMTPEVVTVPGTEGDAKKPRAPRVSTKGKDRFVALKEVASSDKMPLQCKQIMAILNAAPGKVLDRETLLAEMTKVVSTRQPIDRILGFYQSRLVSGNWVKIEAVAVPVSPKVAPAPAAPKA